MFKPSQIVINARTLIETRGWIQNNYSSPHGFCVTGAMSHGTPNSGVGVAEAFEKALVSVAKMIPEVYTGYSLANIEVWNDSTGRTKEQVLDLLNRVVEKLVAEER